METTKQSPHPPNQNRADPSGKKRERAALHALAARAEAALLCGGGLSPLLPPPSPSSSPFSPSSFSDFLSRARATPRTPQPRPTAWVVLPSSSTARFPREKRAGTSRGQHDHRASRKIQVCKMTKIAKNTGAQALKLLKYSISFLSFSRCGRSGSGR